MRAKRKYIILPRASDANRMRSREHEDGRTTAPPLAPGEPAPGEGLEVRARALFSKSRHELIAEMAYLKAEQRGGQGGDPDQDWYDAEAEIEELLKQSRPF